jgi:predicted dehydrogenase
LTVKIVHIGVGGWGLDWEKNAIPEVPGVERVAAVDASPAILEALQAETGIPATACFTSLADAVAATGAEAALITVPLPYHIPVVVEALELGLHAMVEKPFAPTLADARFAVNLAHNRKRILAVSQNYRFFPAVQAVRSIIASRELGRVGSVSIDFRKNVTRAGGGHRHFTLPDPLLVDMAIHHWDLMRYLLGEEATSITCETWNPHWSPFEQDAAGTAIVEFASGAHVSWRGSWVSPAPVTTWTGEWHMECELGELIWQARGDHGWTGDDRVTVRRTGQKPIDVDLSSLPLYGRRGSLGAFANAIATGTSLTPDISGAGNIGILELALAAVQSSATGQRVFLGS